MKKNPLTEEQKSKAVELWKTGLGAPKIAHMIGCGESTVANYFRKIGLKRDKAEMYKLRKENGIVFKSGAHDAKETSYLTGNGRKNY